MKKLSTSLAVPFLVLASVCTYTVCAQPDLPTRSVTQEVMVDDQGEGIYDQFDDPEEDGVDPTPVAPAMGDRILVVGDSEACAVGSYAVDSTWRAHAGLGQPDDVVVVECKVSTTVEYWGAQGHMRRAVDDFRPNVVVVFLGTNHWGARSVPDVRPILDLVKERDLRCVWAGNTAVKGKRWPINALLRTAVSQECVYFDAEAAGIVLADGIHPGPSEAQRWLKDVWRSIPPENEGGVCTW